MSFSDTVFVSLISCFLPLSLPPALFPSNCTHFSIALFLLSFIFLNTTHSLPLFQYPMSVMSITLSLSITILCLAFFTPFSLYPVQTLIFTLTIFFFLSLIHSVNPLPLTLSVYFFSFCLVFELFLLANLFHSSSLTFYSLSFLFLSISLYLLSIFLLYLSLPFFRFPCFSPSLIAFLP